MLVRAVEIKEKYGAWLMVDDAHGAGVLGPSGRGLAEYCGVDARRVDIWMGTLSKTFASVGARWKCRADRSPEALCTRFRFLGWPAAERVVRREPERVARLHKNGAQFLRDARACGLDTGRLLGFGMLPIMVGCIYPGCQVSSSHVRAWDQHLIDHLPGGIAERGSPALLLDVRIQARRN